MIDMIEFIKEAKQAGYTQEQAEFQAKKWHELMSNEIVSKHHLDVRLKNLEEKIDLKLKSMSDQLTIRLGSVMFIGIGVLGFILKH